MNRLICAVMATAVCAAVSAGANREFTITSCRFAPELQNDQGVNDLVECGIDSVSGRRIDMKRLDVFSRHGVGVTACPPAECYWWGGRKGVSGKMAQLYPVAKIARWLDTVPDHPVIIAIDVGDEPSALDFAHHASIVSYVQNRFREKKVLVNLYPHYADAATRTRSEVDSQLGTTTYEEYLHRYCAQYPLDYISFDSYCWGWNNAPATLFEDLRAVGNACAGTGRDMVAVLQANRFSERGNVGVELTANMYRFQAFCALAFGARSICWACWTEGFWKADCIVRTDGTRTVQFDRLKAANREIHRLGDALAPYRRTSTDFVDFDAMSRDGLKGVRQLPVAVSHGAAFADVKALDASPLLVGHFVSAKGDGSQAMVLVSCDDPHDKGGRAHTIAFRAVDGVPHVIASREGGISLEQGDDGRHKLPLRSNEAAVVVMERKE